VHIRAILRAKVANTAIYCLFAATQHAQCAATARYKVDAIAITSKLAANSGYEPFLTANIIRVSIGVAK
jgi:hypothetical protein